MRIFLILLFLFPLLSYAQDESGQYIDRGLLRVQGNIALGIPSGIGVNSMYIAGDWEYYISKDISIKSGTFYHLGYVNKLGYENQLGQNHSVYLGALYHFKTKNNLDPYFGIQPGFAISELVNSGNVTVNPIFSISAGFNYYANRYFNLFSNIQYVVGKHYSDSPAISLNELKISFGLGWHFWARKGYCKFAKPEDL